MFTSLNLIAPYYLSRQLAGKDGHIFVGAESDPVVIPGVDRLSLNYGRKEPETRLFHRVTQEIGVTKRVKFESDTSRHFFSVDSDGAAIKICKEETGSSLFPIMTAEEIFFVGNLRQHGDWYAYTIRGNAIVNLGKIELPMYGKHPIMVSKNRILIVDGDDMRLLVF